MHIIILIINLRIVHSYILNNNEGVLSQIDRQSNAKLFKVITVPNRHNKTYVNLGIAKRPMETVNTDQPLVQIAPMLDVTYSEFRQFMRLITKKSQLWTEMIAASALTHVTEEIRHKWLYFPPNEHPIVAQLGGNDIGTLLEAARMVKSYGYDEINLNVGCPSSRVSGKGCFGAALMREKELVRDIIHRLRRELDMPVTVKHRLGVDELDTYDFIKEFVSTVAESGCDHFIVHSRKAWLKGINPKQNRTIPPLQYERVYQLQCDFPHLKFTINGGFKSVDEIKGALTLENKTPDGVPHKLYGVMVGRMAYENPCELVNVDRIIYGFDNPTTSLTRRMLLENYADYIDNSGESTQKMNLSMVVKPLLGVFHGEYGNKIFRRDNSKQPEIYNLIRFLYGGLGDASKIALTMRGDYAKFSYKRGGTRHAQFIYNAIDVMDKINPESLDSPLTSL